MLLCLTMSMLSYAILFGFDASDAQSYVCVQRYFYCMTGLFNSCPGMWLGLATLFNINKWA